MADEKKKNPDEEQEKKPEAPEAEKPEEKKDEPLKSEPEKSEAASDDNQSDENGEGADKPTEAPEKKAEEEKKEETPEAPQLSETDKLKAENLTLKTQLEAMKIGFAPDCMEDAVTLAEAIVKRDGADISAALQAVAKKYPDWRAESKDGKSKGGFKVGADSSKEKPANEDRLDAAFGIRKKK